MIDAALLILRLGIGLTFAAHGAQKAFGWWAGPGPEGWTGAIRRMGYTPTELFAALSIGAELVGGLLLAVGLATPVVAAVVVAQSIVIIAQAHWSKGFFSTAGGFEFPMILGLGAVSIGLAGPGSWSLDAALGIGMPDILRVGLILVAIVGGLATYRLGRARAAQAPIELPARNERPRHGTGTELRRG